jgi:hypothetical protein
MDEKGIAQFFFGWGLAALVAFVIVFPVYYSKYKKDCDK